MGFFLVNRTTSETGGGRGEGGETEGWGRESAYPKLGKIPDFIILTVAQCIFKANSRSFYIIKKNPDIPLAWHEKNIHARYFFFHILFIIALIVNFQSLLD